jgi:hypothetical protein
MFEEWENTVAHESLSKLRGPTALEFHKEISKLAITGYTDLGKSNITITRNLGDRRKYRSNRWNSLYFGSTFSYFQYFNKLLLLWYESNSDKNMWAPCESNQKTVIQRVGLSLARETPFSTVGSHLTWIWLHLKQNPRYQRKS